MAIPVMAVGDVLQLQQQEVTPIPNMEPWLLGVNNHKGNLLWVMHLEAFLGLKFTSLINPLTAVVVRSTQSDLDNRQIICIVKGIEDVISFDRRRQRSLPTKLPKRSKSVLAGYTRHQGNTHVVLDPLKLFAVLNPDFTATLAHSA
ncbi:chemotaxis protein CheW [Thalassoporum mexicanum]|uniref:chemotaxis protein CheW n=1 Tax=Thalassoporum mexicanum TaxID=3457544 RepID=UPI000315F0CE|nr:chemotaxis protein CheW [Pseudanabaena sp. PCC 7367]